jgi:hypothetical protein
MCAIILPHTVLGPDLQESVDSEASQTWKEVRMYWFGIELFTFALTEAVKETDIYVLLSQSELCAVKLCCPCCVVLSCVVLFCLSSCYVFLSTGTTQSHRSTPRWHKQARRVHEHAVW